MATSWTKTVDKVSEWIDGDLGDLILTEDSKELFREDESHSIASEGVSVTWNGVVNAISKWVAEGIGLKLGTEGTRYPLMTEGKGYYIVLSKTGIWTDVADQSTSWIKVTDA